MFDKFGEMDTFGEINELAENLFNEGDTASIKTMAKENGIDKEYVEMYLSGDIPVLCDADKLLVHLNDCALSASPGGGSLKAQMIARVEYDTIQNCMKAVEEQPTAYDVENMISEVEVKMKAMWYFLDCHSAQCDNESGGDCSYCKKDFYDEIDKIVEQLKNELSNH